MRIEISARETTSLQNGLSDLYTDISSTIGALQKTRSQFYNMSGGVSNLSSAVDSLNQRIQFEERKLDAVKTLNRKTITFLSNAVTTDAQVARMVATSQEKFFQQYEWLRPVVVEEKSWWEQKLDGWNQFWQGAGEAFRNLADKVGGFLSGAVDVVKEVFSTVVTFVKEHWVELLVGATAIVVGAVLLAISGGTVAAFGAALLAGLKAAAISAVVDGAISAAVAWVTGGDVGKALGDGLASGFMMGGIFFAAGAALKVLRTSLLSRKMGSPSKSAQIELNRAQGKEFEITEGQKFKAKYPASDTQITIETIVDGEPVKFRIDQMGYDKNGNLILQELKSSPTATLTKNQQVAWGKNLINDGRYGILENGGIVKGRINETLFPSGFQIPSGTKIEIIRSPIPFKDVEVLKDLSKFTIYSGGITGIIQNVPTIFSNNTAREESAYVYN